MIITREVHVHIELTALDLRVLRDLLRTLGGVTETLSAEHEQLRIDLLYRTLEED